MIFEGLPEEPVSFPKPGMILDLPSRSLEKKEIIPKSTFSKTQNKKVTFYGCGSKKGTLKPYWQKEK